MNAAPSPPRTLTRERLALLDARSRAGEELDRLHSKDWRRGWRSRPDAAALLQRLADKILAREK